MERKNLVGSWVHAELGKGVNGLSFWWSGVPQGSSNTTPYFRRTMYVIVFM